MNNARVRYAWSVIQRVGFQSYRRAFFARIAIVFLVFAVNYQSRVFCFFGGHAVKKKRRLIVLSLNKDDDVIFFAFENFRRIVVFFIAVEISGYNAFRVAAIIRCRRNFPARIIFVEIAVDFRRQNLGLR